MARFNRDLRKRRSVRLRGYDYSRAGAYFVTLCTHRMNCLFGRMVEDRMRLSRARATVRQCWLEIPHHFDHASLDEFVIMPNHLHGILVFDVGAHHGVPLHPDVAPRPTLEGFGRTVSGSLATVLRLFKQAVTRRVASGFGAGADHAVAGVHHGVPLRIWQRNYHEHIIRNEAELEKIREYVRTNPLRWACDRYNPAHGVLVRNGTGRPVPWEL